MCAQESKTCLAEARVVVVEEAEVLLEMILQLFRRR